MGIDVSKARLAGGHLDAEGIKDMSAIKLGARITEENCLPRHQVCHFFSQGEKQPPNEVKWVQDTGITSTTI